MDGNWVDMCHKLAVQQRRTPTIGHGILFCFFLLRRSNFESDSGLKPITYVRAGRARHARTAGRKSHGPPAGLNRVIVISASAKALHSIRETVPVVGMGIEIEARPRLCS
jgi:hypothetical protein